MVKVAGEWLGLGYINILMRSGRHDSLWKVMAAFPEQERDQNAETACQSEIGSGQAGLIGDKAQDRFTHRHKNCEYQRLHGENRRPDVVWYLILNAAQHERS